MWSIRRRWAADRLCPTRSGREVYARNSLLWFLSLNGGFVDTAGFLALRGLFTAHITGNFVTIAATLVSGASGVVTKILALPIFCLTVMLTRVASKWDQHSLGTMLWIEALLLALASICALVGGPFTSSDSATAMATGLLLVSGMAVQNAVQRIHLSALPSSTVMTGNTTQVMLDVFDALGESSGRDKWTRWVGMATAIFSFVSGAGLAALLYYAIGVRCLAAAPILAICAQFAVARRDT